MATASRRGHAPAPHSESESNGQQVGARKAAKSKASEDEQYDENSDAEPVTDVTEASGDLHLALAGSADDVLPAQVDAQAQQPSSPEPSDGSSRKLLYLGALALLGVSAGLAAAGGSGGAGSGDSSLAAQDFAALTPAQIAALTPAQIQALTTQQMGMFSPSQAAALTASQIQLLTNEQLDGWTAAQLGALTSDQLHALSPGQLASLTPEQISTLAPGSVGGLTGEQLAGLSDAQLHAFTPEQVSGLSPGAVSGLNPSQLEALDDVNVAPTFASATATATVAENTPSSHVVYTAAASDANLTAAHHTLTYTLQGADAGYFSIDASTGAVTFKTSPDYEGHTAPYQLIVTATDPDGASATQALTVHVSDVNESPVVAHALGSEAVTVGQAFSFSLDTSAFADPDTSAPNNALSYTATLADGSALPSWLGFDGHTFSGTSPVAGTVAVKVTATDAGPGHLTASQDFDIVSTAGGGGGVGPTSLQLTSLINGVTSFDVTSSIVLSASEGLHKGAAGTITIVDLGGKGPGGAGYGGETITHTQIIDINDPAVSIVNGQVVINPPYDLDLSSHYAITVSAGAFVGNVSGAPTDAVGTGSISFDTVTPTGGTALASMAASQSMDTAGLHDSYIWWDVSHLGSTSSPTPATGDLSAVGPVAVVFQDADTAPTVAGQSGVTQPGGFFVQLGQFGVGDMIYIDDIANNAPAATNDLAALSYNYGSGQYSLEFDGASGAQLAELRYTVTSGAPIVSLADFQTVFGQGAIVSG